MDLLAMLRSSLRVDSRGVEIGAHSLPVEGLNPYYIDRVEIYAGTIGKIDIQADALTLPIPSGHLDYVCASHVLEHLVNPIAAILEWHRVLKSGGFLYLVVPDKRHTFDEPRHVTSPQHIIRNFISGTTVTEIGHVKEFIYESDWSRLRPGTKEEEKAAHQKVLFDAYAKEISEGRAVDIHHHTFTPESLVALLHKAGLVGGSFSFRILGSAERYPKERGDGIGMLLQKVTRTSNREIDTFVFRRSGSNEGIALVCPATLRPLRQPSVGDQLALEDDSQVYPIVHGIPSLLPVADASIRRWWRKRIWRRMWLAGIRVPFAFF